MAKTLLNPVSLFNVIAFNGNVKQFFFGAGRGLIENASANDAGEGEEEQKATSIKPTTLQVFPKQLEFLLRRHAPGIFIALAHHCVKV